MHQNGEYAGYDHLEHNSSKIRTGQQLHAGQEIARVVMMDYTYIPHLHFQVVVSAG
jgi:hypothetical protein